jgi:cardiolipin synthase (CMP-forming)
MRRGAEGGGGGAGRRDRGDRDEYGADDDRRWDDDRGRNDTGYDNTSYDDADYADYEDDFDDAPVEPRGGRAPRRPAPVRVTAGVAAAAESSVELTNRVFTIPNLISLARLAGVPLFLGLILSPHYGGPNYDPWAIVVLMLSGFSDWLDGKLARRWNQMSKLGAMLDPLADRLYILATLFGFAIRTIIPWWLVIVLVGRDVALLIGIVPKLRKAGFGTTLPVHFLGKAATFNLLYAFPLLLIGQSGTRSIANIGNIFGWAFVGWGTALYLWAGVLYFVQLRQVTGTRLAR